LENQGSEAPDFDAEVTPYEIDTQSVSGDSFNFHDYIQGKWAVLFSHPCDKTPVCTTEIAAFAQKQDDFTNRNVRLVGLSVGDLKNHKEWIDDIHWSKTTTRKITFPIVADNLGDVAKDYDM